VPCLWSRHYLGAEAEELAAQADQLTAGPDLVAAIHSVVAYQSLKARIPRPMFRLHLLLAAIAEGDGVIREAIGDIYQEVTDKWEPTYEGMIRAHGLQLRHGTTVQDLTYLLAACAEGLALRAIADPNAVVLDDARQQSLLCTFAIAFFLGCTERADSTDGLTIEQALKPALLPSSA
jgi:hypothetical protein